MPSSARRRALLLLPGTALLFGCASPGPPRSPSLNLPIFATGLTATRHGNTVDVQLHLPTRTTDRLPLRGPLSAELCRNAVCLPRQSFPLATSSATLSDVLPPALASGPPRLLVYRVQLYNAAGRTAGFSDAVYAAAGAPPPPVQGFTLKGSRLGIVASWSTLPNDASAVVLRREDLEPPPAKTSSAAAHQVTPASHTVILTRTRTAEDPNTVWLTTSTPAPSTVLDDAVPPNHPYRYTAERRLTVQLNNRTLVLRSEPTSPIPFSLETTFPPPVPTDLTGASFPGKSANTLAVDLIWQPVDDPHLAGYNVYRQLEGEAKPTRINRSVIALPSFHEELPTPTGPVRYSVTALDTYGNESASTAFTLNPTDESGPKQ